MKRTAASSLLVVPVLVSLLSRSPARAAQQPPFAPGTILTVAGTPGKAGFSGDGGPATNARLWDPWGLAIDAAGNLWIGDLDNARLRRVSPDGTITTVAGGSPGFAGDGGPAAKARFADVNGLAIDAAGNVFICDSANHRLRKLDTTGIVTTVAGGGNPAAGLGDGGPATAAKLQTPVQAAVDRDGNLFIADFSGQRVRKVDSAGMITTVAGGGHPVDGRGDGGPATQAQIGVAAGVAVDEAGYLYIADAADNRVRRVSPDGKITTAAGGGNPADGLGDGGLATDARLDGPVRMAIDPGGNLFITDNHGERIRKVSPAGVITTVAGTGQIGYTADGGPATAARLDSPTALCVDRKGNLYFGEGLRYVITAPNGVPALKTVTNGNMVVREVIGVAVPQ